MKRGGRRWTAAVLAVFLLMGFWGGLLAGQRSAQTMGQTVNALPRLRQEENDITLTLGTKEWRVEYGQMQRIFGGLDRWKGMVPRRWRVAALTALSGLWWVEEELGPAAGKKLLVGAPAPLEAKGTDEEKV